MLFSSHIKLHELYDDGSYTDKETVKKLFSELFSVKVDNAAIISTDITGTPITVYIKRIKTDLKGLEYYIRFKTMSPMIVSHLIGILWTIESLVANGKLSKYEMNEIISDMILSVGMSVADIPEIKSVEICGTCLLNSVCDLQPLNKGLCRFYVMDPKKIPKLVKGE